MSAVITLSVFSGRPNPHWIIDDAAEAELRERIYRRPTLVSAAPPSQFGLGYRGLEIRFENSAEPIWIYGGVIDTQKGSPNVLDNGREIERFLINTMPAPDRGAELAMNREVYALVREHIETELKAKFDLERMARWITPPTNGGCPPCVAACAPPYEATLMWNFSPTQPNNNCYNYANDRVTNTFAQPGLYHNAQYTALTCAGVQPAAVADGLVATNNFTAPLADGWYVALVIWPGADFHWYRQDKTGCWSHKPGHTPAVNVDASNNPITNPQTANRGPYTVFCSFMITRPCKVRIR
jgi:hypothetical protein